MSFWFRGRVVLLSDVVACRVLCVETSEVFSCLEGRFSPRFVLPSASLLGLAFSRRPL